MKLWIAGLIIVVFAAVTAAGLRLYQGRRFRTDVQSLFPDRTTHEGSQ